MKAQLRPCVVIELLVILRYMFFRWFASQPVVMEVRRHQDEIPGEQL